MANDGRKGATFAGVPMKHLSLVTLTFQNSALILVMHYSRVMPLVGGQRYHASTSVFLNEVIKLAISLTMALYDLSLNLPANTSVPTLFGTLMTAVFTNESWKLAIPAVLYTIQNTLQYVAVSNLDAATFQVTYQLKILTTAIFSVLMLGRQLSSKRWLSLVLLVVGVSIVQFPHTSTESATAKALTQRSLPKAWYTRSMEEIGRAGAGTMNAFTRRSATYEGINEDVLLQHPQMNSRIGLTAVLVACALSGLAGVTFEMILKKSPTSPSSPAPGLWVRNVQLSFWSIFPALFLGVVWKDGEAIAKTGFFAGYNAVVWCAIMLQAFGGVVVALVIAYADNIAKNFATSLSIIISALASVFFFDFNLSFSFLVGTSIVLYATYLYSTADMQRSAPLRIAEFEETTIDGNPTFFDKDRSPGRATEARTSSPSRPGTPTTERNQKRNA